LIGRGGAGTLKVRAGRDLYNPPRLAPGRVPGPVS